MTSWHKSPFLLSVVVAMTTGGCVIGLHGTGVSTVRSIGMAAAALSSDTANGKGLTVELDRGVLVLIGN